MSRSTILNVAYRVLYWSKVIRFCKPATFGSATSLISSIIIDIPLYFLTRQNPLNLRGGVFLSNGFYFFTRPKTDDLYHITPRREKFVEEIIVNVLKKGDIFIDVGANVGYFTILASRRVGVEGMVIAIECVPSTFEILRYNLGLNNISNVLPLNKCAWNKKEKVTISFQEGFYGSASALFGSTSFNYQNIKVDAIPLDEILSDLDHIRLIKIDVEGAEFNVLEGLTESLSKVDYIIVELSYKIPRTLKLLQQYRFKMRRLGSTKTFFAYKNL